MTHYKATRDYKSNFRSKPVAFSKGDESDVDDDLAEWVNRDSPGTLVLAKAKPKPAKKADGRASRTGQDDG